MEEDPLMTADQSERICEIDSYAIKVPKELLDMKTLTIIQNSHTTYFDSKASQRVFFVIYPYILDGTGWAIPDLFQEVSKDPHSAEVVKSVQALRYHMQQFADAGVLVSHNGDGKATFHLSPEIWWNLLSSPQFKEEVEYQYHHIYIITCIITRMLKNLFPLTTVNSIYDLTRTMVQICSELAIADLRERNIPEQTCRRCIYPCQEAETPMIQEPIEDTNPAPAAIDPPSKKASTVIEPAEMPLSTEISPLPHQNPPGLKGKDETNHIPQKIAPTPPVMPSQPTGSPFPTNEPSRKDEMPIQNVTQTIPKPPKPPLVDVGNPSTNEITPAAPSFEQEVHQYLVDHGVKDGILRKEIYANFPNSPPSDIDRILVYLTNNTYQIYQPKPEHFRSYICLKED